MLQARVKRKVKAPKKKVLKKRQVKVSKKKVLKAKKRKGKK